MTRVVHIATDSGTGGTEHRIADYLRHSDPEEFEHVFLPLKPPGEVARSLSSEGFEVQALGIGRRDFVTGVRRLVSLIRKYRPDLIQTYLYGGNVLGRTAARIVGTPSVSGYASTDPWMRAREVAADRLTARFSEGHLANSYAVAEAASARCKIPIDQFTVVRTGREIGVDNPSPRTRSKDRFQLLAVGRLHASKGYPDLLQAVARLPDGVILSIAGDGPLRREIESEISRHGLDGRVELLGSVSRKDLAVAYAAADLFVTASRWEGLSGSLVEAAAAGLPAVATDVGGAGEVIEDGVSGILVPPGDVSALAGAISKLLGDEPLRLQMGGAARARAAAEFEVGQMAREWDAFYRRILG